MIRILKFFVPLFLLYQSGNAQCGDDTYNMALLKAGNDVVLIRDFKVKLNEGNKRNPSPSSKFSVLMQKDLTYRFVIAHDTSLNIIPILQLFDRNQLLGSTYNSQTGTKSSNFEYKCNRTGNYQVYISNKDAAAGCSIGLMAMVTDSSFYAQGNTKQQNEKYVLYTGIENPLHIITDQKNIKKIEILADKGEVYHKDSAWYARFQDAGTVKLQVKLINYSDTIIEEVTQEFSVISLPKPKVTLEGAISDYIIPSALGPLVKLQVQPSIYRIQEFYISEDLSFGTGLQSYSDYLTNEMVAFIKSLMPQNKFYIKNIIVVGPDGSSQTLGPITYYIR